MSPLHGIIKGECRQKSILEKRYRWKRLTPDVQVFCLGLVFCLVFCVCPGQSLLFVSLHLCLRLDVFVLSCFLACLVSSRVAFWCWLCFQPLRLSYLVFVLSSFLDLVLSRLVFVLFCLVLSFVFCLLSCLVLSCLVSSCLALSCLALSCLALSCLVLSCVLSCLVFCLVFYFVLSLTRSYLALSSFDLFRT